LVDIQVVTAVDCFHIVLMLSDFFFSISVVPAHLVSWSKGFNIELFCCWWMALKWPIMCWCAIKKLFAHSLRCWWWQIILHVWTIVIFIWEWTALVKWTHCCVCCFCNDPAMLFSGFRVVNGNLYFVYFFMSCTFWILDAVCLQLQLHVLPLYIIYSLENVAAKIVQFLR